MLLFREILQDLRTYLVTQYGTKISDSDENEYVSVYKKTIKIDKEYNLQAAQALLLAKISVDLNESSSTIHEKSDAICSALCKNEVFLPNLDDVSFVRIFRLKDKTKAKNKMLKRVQLPLEIIQFWKDIIFLLHEKRMLEMLLFKLLDIVEQEREDEERRHLAALWINSIFCSFGQLIMAQSIFHTLEYTMQKKSGKLDMKISSQRIKENLQEKYPYLRNILWLDISNTVPYFLRDENFLSRLLLNTNKFSSLLIDPIFKWFTSNIDEQTKAHLLELLLTYTFPEYDNVNMDSNNDVSKIYTVQDLDPNPIENEMQIRNKIKRATKKKTAHSLADQVIRNLHWKSAHGMYLQFFKYIYNNLKDQHFI